MNLLVTATKCFLICYLYIQSCHSSMISFIFSQQKTLSSYLFSEKYVVFNLPPQTYRKKGDSNVIFLDTLHNFELGGFTFL